MFHLLGTALLMLLPLLTGATAVADGTVDAPKGYRRLSHAEYHKEMQSHPHYDSSLPYAHSAHALHELPRDRMREQQQRLRRLRSLAIGGKTELTPLFPGYGTHYAYLYIGTPPQRQSVIVDTGSHYTAFPCSGCSQCGTHTDPYFLLSNSSTAEIPKCLKDSKCLVSQSYTEGSSWHGFKVNDKLWVGDSSIELLPHADDFAVAFTFACQTSETGLFRTQLADGIMGMSHAEDTLPTQLLKQKVTESDVFSLCYRVGGGIMTLGGVDQRIHSKRSPIAYATTTTQNSGWFTVSLLSVHLEVATADSTKGPAGLNPEKIVVENDEKVLNTGKGVIVDSGTTDTYLPSTISAKFVAAFKRATGNTIGYSNSNSALSAEQIKLLPTIVFTLQGKDEGEKIEVSMAPSSYLDSVGGGKYAMRVYLTEKSGAVLGANFMTDHNVVFDAAGGRVGFAKSACNYEEFAPIVTDSPTLRPAVAPTKSNGKGKSSAPTKSDDAHTNDIDCDPDELVPYTACTATCERNESAYITFGKQQFIPACPLPAGVSLSSVVVTKNCSESCVRTHIVRGDPQCPDTAWSECAHGCITSRQAVPLTEPLRTHSGACNYRTQTQTCYAGLCPRETGDFIVYVDMRVRIEARHWSYVHTESFYEAMKKLYKLKGNSIELLNNVASSLSSSTKLHFQVRLKAKDFKSTVELHAAAEKIVTLSRSVRFPTVLIAALRQASLVQDKNKLDRFGWLFSSDVEVLSAVALPIGDIRDPSAPQSLDGNQNASTSSQIDFFDLILIGVALGALMGMAVLLYTHLRLRKEYDLMSKDKSSLAKTTESLQKLWRTIVSKNSKSPADERLANLSREKLEEELRLAQSGLMHDSDELVDDEELHG